MMVVSLCNFHNRKLLLTRSHSFQSFPGLAVYSGTKYFVEALTQGLRLELVGSGVKVTAIQPGLNTSNRLFERLPFFLF